MENQEIIFEKPVDDYLRVMTASTEVFIANPEKNKQSIMESYEQARQEQAELLVTQELNTTGYSAADLFFNRHVLEQSNKSLVELAEVTENGPAMVVGAPVERNGILYNCAVMMSDGQIKGVVPKTYLPNYNEFYEKRWFQSGKRVTDEEVEIEGVSVPFGTDILFDINNTRVGVEICEDAWASITPGTHATLQGAEVIVNLSASNELTGKANFRRKLVTDHASRLICAYVYTSAGKGESTADVIFSGHQLIAENGRLVKEIKPFETGTLAYDIDREYIKADRIVNTTYAEEADDERSNSTYRTIKMNAPKPTDNRLLREVIGRPFGSRESCMEVFGIISQGLSERMAEIGGSHPVIGLSGGLDSTLAIIVAVEAAKKNGLNPDFVNTITMPGMASSERTQDNASLLAEALGTTHKVIPINDISHQILEAIGHDRTTEDITYENTQARTRTEILMNYANMIGGFVQGTGDLSESAQGWCTYNGDHMSMFNPNANVFKTMARDIVKWYADEIATIEVKEILYDILDTPVSPELTGNGDLSQTTEDIIGPYELHEFFQVELQRHRNRPEKIGYLATQATFGNEYSQEEIAHWLDSFLYRYTANQWKRDVMPNGTMVGTVGVSPRGPLRMAPNTDIDWSKYWTR